MAYGDILRLDMTPDFSAMYSMLMSFDQTTGLTNRINKNFWLSVQAPEGGYNNLLNLISVPWGNAQDNQGSVLCFLTLDPAALAPPADPHPALPTQFYGRPSFYTPTSRVGDPA